ncbi:MAG: histidinol-phosphate transaminase [Actinomycetota bacterium]
MGTAPRYRWQPTTAEIAARYGLRPSEVVRFDHNTSPFPTDWAPAIVAPMSRHLNEYPGASYMPLRESIARYVGGVPENVVPGAGIDEMILLVAKAFGGPGTRSSTAVPTYPLYEIAAMQHHGEFKPVSYGADLEYPLDGVSRMAESSNITWLCVPNNPTGERIPNTYIAEIIRKASGIVVIDAAYAEFAGDTWWKWVEAYDNLIVLQTLSKAFGLAALRVGYSIASPDLSARLDAFRPPGSISTLSERIARVALEDHSRMERFVRFVSKERERLAALLVSAGLTVYPSSTNFLLCHVGPHARGLAHGLVTKGIVVRSYPQDHVLGDHLRFTVRSQKEDDRLVDMITWIYPQLLRTTNS